MDFNKERLTECRKAMQITKMEAAKRCNMAQPTYLRYENGDRKPSLHVLQTIAETLHTSVEYLTDRSDDPKPVRYTVTMEKDPELFLFVENYRSADKKQKEHLIKYLEAFEKKGKK